MCKLVEIWSNGEKHNGYLNTFGKKTKQKTAVH